MSWRAVLAERSEMQTKDVLVRPLITEKSATGLADNTYAFEVGLRSTKADVAKAVGAAFGVEVDAVRTLVVRGKSKRFGRFTGKRSNWKKAYVTLKEGSRLNLLEGQE